MGRKLAATKSPQRNNPESLKEAVQFGPALKESLNDRTRASASGANQPSGGKYLSSRRRDHWPNYPRYKSLCRYLEVAPWVARFF